jgi:hypothetical protein
MKVVTRLHEAACLVALSLALGCSTVIGIDGSYTDLDAATTSSAGGPSGSQSEAGAPGSCAGVALHGACWYLGELGQSCTVVCDAHGGSASDAASFVGVPAQGGSLAKCAELLSALGDGEKPTEATRSDDSGVGCHIYATKSYWLSSPTYTPSAHLGVAKLVCGCLE